MGLEKAIEHGKEKRQPYKDWRAISQAARNHGADRWYTSNRLHKFKKDEPLEDD